jgi:hypothetical protein
MVERTDYPPRMAMDVEDARKIEAVRSKIARALADPGPSIPASVVFDRIDRLIKSLQR